MTQKTNTIPTLSAEQAMPASQVSQDLKHAVLIVSLVANLAVLTTWIAVQVTSQYDAQLASLLLIR